MWPRGGRCVPRDDRRGEVSRTISRVAQARSNADNATNLALAILLDDRLDVRNSPCQAAAGGWMTSQTRVIVVTSWLMWIQGERARQRILAPQPRVRQRWTFQAREVTHSQRRRRTAIPAACLTELPCLPAATAAVRPARAVSQGSASTLGRYRVRVLRRVASRRRHTFANVCAKLPF